MRGGCGCALLLTVVLSGCTVDDGRIDPDLPAGSSAPHLAVGSDGAAVLSFLTPDGIRTRLSYVVLEPGGWSQPREVASGEDWFVNWADVPSVVPLTGDLWAAHWLVRSASDPFAYDVRVALSRDGGIGWSPGVLLHADGTRTEHGFVSLYPVADGVGAVWLDGRNLASNPDGATALFSAVVQPSDQTVTGERLVDARVCDCCQTDVAMTDTGPVVVYRDRSGEEVRDIALSRSEPGGWAAGRIVAADGWQVRGCPVNGPAVDARGRRVAVAWYTAHPERRVVVAFSDDAGDTFTDPIDVHAGTPLGRVDVVLLESDGAAVSWLDAVPGVLNYRQVAANGTLGTVVEVARLSPERDAGFPQMVRVGGELVFAWKDVTADRVQSRRLRLDP